MSTENITAFLTKLQTDAALADKVSLATAEALADLAAREGLPFTAEEFLSEQVNAIYEQADLAVAQALAGIASEHGLPFTVEEFLTEEHSVLPDEELTDVSGGITAISPRIRERQREKEGNRD